MVRWSVSKPSRGRRASTRSASKAHSPTGCGAGGRQRGQHAVAPAGGDEQVGGVRPGPGHPAHEAAAVQRLGPQRRRHRQPGLREHGRGLRADEREHGPVGADVGGLDALEEPHLLQVGEHLGRGARLGVDPDGAAELGELPVLLDVPVRGQHERLGRVAVAERAQVLGGDGVQPAEPVLARDGEDVAVAAVDHAGARGQHALLAQRVAVVPGHAGVAPGREHTAVGGGEVVGSGVPVSGSVTSGIVISPCSSRGGPALFPRPRRRRSPGTGRRR